MRLRQLQIVNNKDISKTRLSLQRQTPNYYKAAPQAPLNGFDPWLGLRSSLMDIAKPGLI
jgi:hypothetical protein